MGSSRLAKLSLSLTPYLAMGALMHYCRKRKNLQDQLEVTPLLRKALMVHFVYFIGVPINIEVFPDIPGLDSLVGPFPTSTGNVFHMIQCLAAENFFVVSTALGFILMQKSVPRWTLMTPYAQIAWNLKNHIDWWFLAGTFSPEGPLPFALADMVLIWPIAAIYSHHFLTAKKAEKKN